MAYHINFRSLGNNDLDFDGDPIVYPNTGKSFVDKKIPTKLRKNNQKILNFITQYRDEFVEDKKYLKYIKDQINKNNNVDTIKKLCVYTHSDMKIIYTYIKNKYSKNEFFIASDNTNYLITGVIEGHPFIITNDFTYGNSDGSGPSYMVEKKYDVSNIIAQLKKYYNEFCSNIYH